METQARLIVDIARLESEGEAYKGETSIEVLDLGESELLAPLSGIRYNLFIQLLDTEMLVRGTLSLHLQCICVRCGAIFETDAVERDFVESYEISPENAFMDLTDALREAIILALPGYPVCQEACKGLCMKCGANLNTSKCSCNRKGNDMRWAALNALDAQIMPVEEEEHEDLDRGKKRGRKPTVKEK